MANYINKNIICQSYIHVDPVNLPEEKFDLLQKELGLFLQTRGRFFLYDEVDTNVELKDGSLKVYATILGSLYIAIGQYGSFRSGLNYLVQDTKRLAECIASESLYLSQSRHHDTLRVEARTGVAGKLKAIIDKFEAISEELGEVDAKKSADKLNETTNALHQLLDSLNDPKDPDYVKSELCELIKKWFPPRLPKNPRKPHSPEGLVAYREERKWLRDTVKT